MDWKRGVSLGFAIVAIATGLAASWYWYRASKVKNNPAWELIIDPGAAPHNTMGHVAGLMLAWQSAGKLNAKAALWTAVSVMCSVVSALLGSL
jgi:hypothetical protein